MSAALARFLPDFELAGIRAQPRADADRPRPAPPAVELPDLDAIRAAAREEARAEAEAELNQRHGEAMAAAAARHQAELSALRQEFAALAAAIPEAVSARAATIADGIAADVAAVLGPLLDTAMQQRMIAALAAEIRKACALDSQASISVSGPRPMLDALGAALDGTDAELVLTESASADLVVTMDRSRWTTRLADWSASLEEALA